MGLLAFAVVGTLAVSVGVLRLIQSGVAIPAYEFPLVVFELLSRLGPFLGVVLAGMVFGSDHGWGTFRPLFRPGTAPLAGGDGEADSGGGNHGGGLDHRMGSGRIGGLVAADPPTTRWRSCPGTPTAGPKVPANSPRRGRSQSLTCSWVRCCAPWAFHRLRIGCRHRRSDC